MHTSPGQKPSGPARPMGNSAYWSHTASQITAAVSVTSSTARNVCSQCRVARGVRLARRTLGPSHTGSKHPSAVTPVAIQLTTLSRPCSERRQCSYFTSAGGRCARTSPSTRRTLTTSRGSV